MIELQQTFLRLIRQDTSLFCAPDWKALQVVASQQGLMPLVIEGLEKVPEAQRPPRTLLLHWIGQSFIEETQYNIQWKAACELAVLLKNEGIRTVVLKGNVVSECYPIPQHRRSVDLDCFLLPESGSDDVWEKSNQIIERAGFKVKRDYYKNSTWLVPGLSVENHRWLTPFRGNKRLMALERLLQKLIREDLGASVFEGTYMYRPPVMASALFLIEHAYSHFLHEGLIWRHVLDWMMFNRKHQEEINWNQLDKWIDTFGFRKFYKSYSNLGKFLLGEIDEADLSGADKMMLEDIWKPLDLHETVNGVKGKLNLVGNTWRARRKYEVFTEMTWIQALWIQVKGVLFMKGPRMT